MELRKIPLIYCPSSYFQIYVKTLTGRTLTLDVYEYELIEDVKIKIKNKVDMPSDKQNIIFAGMQLEEGKTLADYKIGKECTIYLVLRPRRGVECVLISDFFTG